MNPRNFIALIVTICGLAFSDGPIEDNHTSGHEYGNGRHATHDGGGSGCYDRSDDGGGGSHGGHRT